VRAGQTPGLQRRLAAALALGGAFLTYRAAVLLATGHDTRFVPWLAALTWVELALAGLITGLALLWLVTGTARWRGPVLRLTAGLVVLHAVRVGVFVAARAGPWGDFDLRPEFRPLPAEAWSWGEVWFAGAMAALALLVVLAVARAGRSRRRERRRRTP